MVYQIKVYRYKKLKCVCKFTCGDDYLNAIKDDMLNVDVEYLDLNSVIIPKAEVKLIKIKTLSEN